jgi:PEP-CTERM motif
MYRTEIFSNWNGGGGVFSLRTQIPLFATAILLVAPAEATTTYYAGSSAESAFNTAVGGLTLLDPALTFSDTPASNGLLNASGTGINFLGFDDFVFQDPLSFTESAGNLTAAAFGEVVEITFPATGVYAFAIHFTNTSGLGNWCIDLTTTGCNYSVPETAPAVQFFGIVSDTSITAPLYIHAAASPKIVFTNFEAYGADPVPEPGTLLLIGFGLVILPLAQKKARRKRNS